MITIYAALGFTLFGAFAGVLLTIRFWYGQIRKPGMIRQFVVSMRQSALVHDPDGMVAKQLFHDCAGGPPTCPLCDLPLAVGLRVPITPITEEDLRNMAGKDEST